MKSKTDTDRRKHRAGATEKYHSHPLQRVSVSTPLSSWISFPNQPSLKQSHTFGDAKHSSTHDTNDNEHTSQ